MSYREHKTDYFRDEVRCGFYIPTAIKQAWAAEMDVLSEIDRICRKYGITYFADWGTFLGAVRHAGFVPWDDDLDICMKRKDYIRFRQVADKELPKEFVIHDYERQEDHWLFLTRIVNNSHICFEEEHLKKYHNFPWLAGVDIFLLDHIYRDEEKEKERCNEVLRLIAVADGVTENSLNPYALKEELSKFEKKYNVRLLHIKDKRELSVSLYRLAEEQMARTPESESDSIGQIFPWVLKGGKGQPKHYYDKSIELPFEDITIPVPSFYKTLLSARYGNFLEIRKVWTGHDYPFFEGQKRELLGEETGLLPEFSFKKEMLERPKTDQSGSLKEIAGECLKEMEDGRKRAMQSALSGDREAVVQELAACQQLAVDLGTLTEAVKGEERDCTRNTVAALEYFCEKLYLCAQAEEPEEMTMLISSLNEDLRETEAVIRKELIERDEVLFLPIGPDEWGGFEEAYRECLESSENADIYIVPLPLLPKDFFGRVIMSDEDIEKAVQYAQYPDLPELTDRRQYSLDLHCPETIYIQNPYDGENPVLTVLPEYYAKNLRKYTKELIFIPFAGTGEFSEEDINDLYNMKHYVCAPGVVYADRVIVQSENIRKQYIDCLTTFAGGDTREHWSERIETAKRGDSGDGYSNRLREASLTKDPDKTAGHSLPKTEKKKAGKSILYCIGANELEEHKELLTDAVKNRLRIFSEAGNDLDMKICLYPPDREEWKRINRALAEKLFKVAAEEGRQFVELFGNVPLEAERIAEGFDAYYGSPSPFVPAFTLQKKPVMISDYSVDC